MVSFKALRETIPIADVCKLLNVKLTKNKGRCPCCGRNAFKITPSKGLWYCFKCEEHGDGLQLYSQVTKLPVREAAVELQRRLGRP